MRSFVVFSVLLCCVGCSSSRKVTVRRLAPGMSLSEVRSVAGRLEWVALTPKSSVYRGEFAAKPNCGFFCRTYPVLLVFDNEAKLMCFRRDSAEELRRRAEREMRREMRGCDSCDYGRYSGRGGRSYSGQGLNDVYRSISSYGRALHSHDLD